MRLTLEDNNVTNDAGKNKQLQGFSDPDELAKAYSKILNIGSPKLVSKKPHLVTYTIGNVFPAYYIYIRISDGNATPLLWDAYQLLQMLEGNFYIDFPPRHDRAVNELRNWLSRYRGGER